MKRLGLTLLIATAAMASACTPVPSAQKNGTLVKLAHQGKVFKTWEAELVRGGSYTGGTGVQGAPFDFTVADPALLAKVKTAFDEQQEVRITYHRSWPTPFSSETGNFLDSIEVISADQGGTQRGPAAANAPAGTSMTPAQVDKLLDNQSRLIDAISKR
jgi:hypothetical protein